MDPIILRRHLNDLDALHRQLQRARLTDDEEAALRDAVATVRVLHTMVDAEDHCAHVVDGAV